MKIEFREMTVYSKLNIYLRSCKLLRKDPIFRRVVVNKTRNHYYLSNINLPATVDWISPPPPSILTYAERDALRTSTKANSAAAAVSKKKPTSSADIQNLNKADKKRLIFGLSGSSSTTQASIPDSRWTTSRKSRGAATDDDEMDWKDASSTSKSRTPRHSKKRHRTSFGPCNPDGLRPELKCIPPYQDLLLSDKLPFVPSASSPTTNALLLPPQTYYFVQNERCMNKPKFGGEIRCRSCIWKHRERLPYCFFVGFRAFRVRFDDELNGGGDVQKTEETTSMDVDLDGVVKSDRTIGGNPVTFDPADKYRIISDVPAENLVYGPFFIPDGRDVGVPVAVTVKQVCAVTAGTTRAELLEKCGLTEDGFVVTEASAMMHINQVDGVPQNPESVIVDIVQPNVAQHAETIVNDVKESNFARQIEPVAVDVDEPASAQCDETILVEEPIPEATMVDIEEPTLKQTKTVVEEPMPEPIVVHTETSTLGQQIPKNQDLVAAIIDKPGVQHEATAPLAPIAVNSTTNKVETVSPTKSSPIAKNPATSPKKRRSSVSRRQIDVKDFPDLLKTTTPFPFVPSSEDSNNNELLVPSGAHYHVQQDKCLREKYADFPKCRSCRWKQKDRLPNCFYIGFRAFLVNDWESLVQAAKVADEDGSADVLGDDGLRLVCDVPAENMVYGPYFIPGGVDVTSSAVSPVKRTKRKRRGSRRSLSASDADGEEGDNEEFGGEANKKVALLEEVQEEEKRDEDEVEPSREMSIESPEEVETEPEVAVEDAPPVVDQIEEPEDAEDFITESRPESTLVSTPVISSHPVNSPLDIKPSLVIQPPLSQLQSQSSGLSQQHQPATVVYSHLPPISHHPSFAQQMQQQQPVPIMYPQPILTPIIYSHSVVPPPTLFIPTHQQHKHPNQHQSRSQPRIPLNHNSNSNSSSSNITNNFHSLQHSPRTIA
ncbi:hypothetical protein BCR33DRAFT_180199 [Rhizoclosmatium globosum]|uniref:Uncharacterized protein n=1 Tax=Rhizoclosmatium globosum TaxID=329046 RepID=A0A1Y2D144_9FUNG|nr:hypothetical protein BCR33DRAFT_180199 [Rhizoclosmatium globosum]|eukprot:ORY52856.1 hypothetical protein BCR33DRAFT_180199 [Rhizoclosmatium globosum]